MVLLFKTCNYDSRNELLLWLQGSLKFDHEHRKLDILMAPTDGGNTLMNTNSLSGGEKSYSTVAFLLALWSNMELPFYSLDEYDVFMVLHYTLVFD